MRDGYRKEWVMCGVYRLCVWKGRSRCASERKGIVGVLGAWEKGVAGVLMSSEVALSSVYISWPQQRVRWCTAAPVFVILFISFCFPSHLLNSPLFSLSLHPTVVVTQISHWVT